MLDVPDKTVRELLAHAQKTCPVGGKAYIAAKADIPDIITLSKRSFTTNPVTSRNLRYGLDRGNALILIHRDDAGTLTSYCVLEFYPRQARAYLSSFCTAPELRGKGLGQWYIDLLEWLGQRLKYRFLSSHVAQHNKNSLNLHLKNGYAVTRELHDYYDDGSSAYYLRKETR